MGSAMTHPQPLVGFATPVGQVAPLPLPYVGVAAASVVVQAVCFVAVQLTPVKVTLLAV
jgi:hypothetical protein